MSDWVDIGAAADLADGAMIPVTADGTDLLVARAGDAFYVADDRCPHEGARLSAGFFDESIVTCPRHGSRFDLRDGHVKRWVGLSGLALKAAGVLAEIRPLHTYPAKVEDGRLLVDLGPDS
jgi:nitrite reductase/ring-hydroxylating ferredoxin subunit